MYFGWQNWMFVPKTNKVVEQETFQIVFVGFEIFTDYCDC